MIYIEKTLYPGGTDHVLTMSYDDGTHDDRRLVEIFNKYGIRGTFHLNSGLMDEKHVQPEEIPTLYKGHEVSCHTVTHPTIARCPLPNVVEEVLADRRALEKYGFSYCGVIHIFNGDERIAFHKCI